MTKLWPLVGVVIVGCNNSSYHDLACRESAELLSSGHNYSRCDEKAKVEIRGSVALCHCPGRDGGSK